MFPNLYLNWDKVVRYLGVFLLLSPVVVIAGCDLLVVTGTVGDLLLAMRDISCRVIFLLSIGSLLIVVLTLSVIVLFCVVLSFPLAIATVWK